MDAEAVAARLGLGDAHQAWLQSLESVTAPGAPLGPLAPGAAAALLRSLGAAPLDIAEAAAAAPRPDRDPELCWLLEHCCARLAAAMGDPDAALGDWPPLPAALGDRGRFFYAHVFLAMAGPVRRWHAARGVPEQATRETLGTLARVLRIHRERQGCGGVFEMGFHRGAFRCTLFELGRLQYAPFRLLTGRGGPRRWYDEAAQQRLGPGFCRGDPTVGIHIPASGPLTPEACAASLRRARDLFARPGPFGPCRIAVCGTWLLDEQLAEYLPATSNLVRFQRRFQMIEGAGNGDGSIFNFVFHHPAPVPLEVLPQRTTLERAAVAHWRSGRHWRTRLGWIEL